MAEEDCAVGEAPFDVEGLAKQCRNADAKQNHGGDENGPAPAGDRKLKSAHARQSHYDEIAHCEDGNGNEGAGEGGAVGHFDCFLFGAVPRKSQREQP